MLTHHEGKGRGGSRAGQRGGLGVRSPDQASHPGRSWRGELPVELSCVRLNRPGAHTPLPRLGGGWPEKGTAVREAATSPFLRGPGPGVRRKQSVSGRRGID